MGKFGIWEIKEQKPVKIDESEIELEKHLEEWIKNDPQMLPGGLEIICQQMRMAGGRLDLLALDPQGRWVVIEIKAGALDAAVITQALYYAAQIDKMPFQELESKIDLFLKSKETTLREMLDKRGIDVQDQLKEREMIMVLVGTHRLEELDTVIEFMGKKVEIPISSVTFEVFKLDNNHQILVREMTGFEGGIKQPPKKPAKTIEELYKMAEENGIGVEFHKIFETAKSLGLHFRRFKRCIMYAPDQDHTRMLFTIFANKKPIKAYIGNEVFTEFFAVNETQVRNAIGPEGWRSMNPGDVDQFIIGLKSLIQIKE